MTCFIQALFRRKSHKTAELHLLYDILGIQATLETEPKYPKQAVIYRKYH